MPLPSSFYVSGPPQFNPNDISDPLTRQILSPRKNETESERHGREQEEREASKRSKDIDDWIERDRIQKERERKRKKTSKIMLLGQSQSGKSTTLKNFQLHFAPSAFEAERSRWKTVIHLNLVRSLRKIHEALTLHLATQTSGQAHASLRASPIIGHIRNNPSLDLYGTAQTDEDDEGYDPGVSSQHQRFKLSPQHRLLLLRLRPILSLERQLLRALLPGSQLFYGDFSGFEAPWRDSTAWRSEHPDYHSSPVDPQSSRRISSLTSLDEISIPASFSPYSPTSITALGDAPQPVPIPAGPVSFSHTDASVARASARSPLGRPSMPHAGRTSSLQIEMKQISVRAGSLPKDSMDSYSVRTSRMFGGSDTPSAWGEGTPSAKRNIASPTPSGFETGDVPDRVLAACAQDILALWNDAFLRNLLCGPLAMGGLGLKLHEDAGFFLNDVERITSSNYLPTDDDIVRARLKTMGVSEHRFVVENPTGIHTYVGELIVYDVGGSRTQRHRWMPFFDDINVIVFLAPISAFDQRLAEDPKINRLLDTFALWKDICQTPMLAKVDCLLFLNKCDLLHAKLKSGLVLKKFIPQYNGENNLVDAVKYFRGIFLQIWRMHTDELRKSTRTQRAIYTHSTSMIDIVASHTVIKNGISVQVNCELLLIRICSSRLCTAVPFANHYGDIMVPHVLHTGSEHGIQSAVATIDQRRWLSLCAVQRGALLIAGNERR